MNVRFLETFLWVASLRSPSAAARRLRVSQSVVSMRIAALQRMLGAELYHGSGRSFELTPAGHRILSKCSTVVSLTGELLNDAKDPLPSRNEIRIGVSKIVTLSWLPEFLEALQATHRHPLPAVRSASHSELMACLRAGELDIVFLPGLIDDPTLESDFICQYDVKWVGSPALMRGRTEMRMADLVQLPILQSPQNSYRRAKVLEYFRWHGMTEYSDVQPHNWVGFGFGIADCAHLASKGVGVAALPVTAVESFLERGQLQVLPIQQEFLPWQIVALSRRRDCCERLAQVVSYAKQAASAFSRTARSRYFKAA